MPIATSMHAHAAGDSGAISTNRRQLARATRPCIGSIRVMVFSSGRCSGPLLGANGESNSTSRSLYFDSFPAGGKSSNSSIVGTSLALRISRRNRRAVTGVKANAFSPSIRAGNQGFPRVAVLVFHGKLLGSRVGQLFDHRPSDEGRRAEIDLQPAAPGAGLGAPATVVLAVERLVGFIARAPGARCLRRLAFGESGRLRRPRMLDHPADLAQCCHVDLPQPACVIGTDVQARRCCRTSPRRHSPGRGSLPIGKGRRVGEASRTNTLHLHGRAGSGR